MICKTRRQFDGGWSDKATVASNTSLHSSDSEIAMYGCNAYVLRKAGCRAEATPWNGGPTSRTCSWMFTYVPAIGIEHLNELTGQGEDSHPDIHPSAHTAVNWLRVRAVWDGVHHHPTRC